MTTYLERANAKLVCACTCRVALASASSQGDCPWCGCGWLFACMTCRRAFTFARGVEVDDTLEDLAVRDLTVRADGDPPSPAAVGNWVDWMTVLLRGVEPGRAYVYLDGFYVPADAGPIRFEGRHADHDLPWVPQVRALVDRSALDDTLGSEDYWAGHETDAHADERRRE